MPVITEIFVADQGNTDASGNGWRPRKFHVQHDRGADPLQESGVPRPFEPYGLGSRLRADDFAIEAINDNPTSDSWVTVRYSTDGRFRFDDRVPAPDSPEFLGIGWETQDDTIVIPALIAVDVATPAVDPLLGTPYVARGIKWERDDFTNNITYEVIERTVLVEVPDYAAAHALRLTLKAKHGKYHFFDNTFYKFQVRSFRQRSLLKYEVLYLWTSDPGTPALVRTRQNRIVPTVERPPFWRYLIIASDAPTPEESSPEPIIEVEPTDGPGMNDFNGWIGLPGSPI